MNEIRRTANWLYTAVGPFNLYIWSLVSYKVSRPDVEVDFPVVGKISYTATLIFGIPTLTIATLFTLYLCFKFLCIVRVKPASYCHYFPSPFDLALNTEFKNLRCLFFFFFTVPSTLASAVLYYRLFEQRQIINMNNDAISLSKWSLFKFEARWWDGELWRWTSDVTGERLSAYPGFQMCLYALLITACFVSIAYLALKIVSLHKKLPDAPTRN